MNEPTRDSAHTYDVVVLGRHLATGLLATILARHGVRTALVPAEPDRILPAGESTVPYTAELFFLLGRRFEVPPIEALGMFSSLPEPVRATSGAKQNLGFLYHRPGQWHRDDEALRFTVPSEHAEWHIHRPDVDDYAIELARSYGAAVLDTEVVPGGVALDDTEIRVALRDGCILSGRYLVDGSGDARLLPPGVRRPDGGSLRHRARLLTAHLAGVRPFEEILPPAAGGTVEPWSKGTATHVFDGGWLQVCPFGNHDGGRNPHHGVTLSIEPDRYPGVGDPGEDFRSIVGRFPELGRQFACATEQRPWQRYDGWPVVAADCVGPRWLLFDRSAGRHDLLLSRDVTNSLEMVHAVAAGLLEVARTRDWAGDGMKPAADFQLRLLAFQDRLLAAGRTATRDFALWNAYLRVWLLWTILCSMSVKRSRLDGEAGTGPYRWSGVEQFDQAPYWYPVPVGLPELVDDALAAIETVRDGADPGVVADGIFLRLRLEPFVPPLFDFGDPAAHRYVLDDSRRERLVAWLQTAPDDVRRLVTEENVTGVAQQHGV